MNYIVKIEGQEIPVPEEIGATDDAVKRALAPFYPEVAGAMITRVVTNENTVTLNVIKKAGSKGAAGLDFLRECPSHQNPAIELYQEIHEKGDSPLNPVTLLELDKRIGDAIIAGEQQVTAIEKARERLAAAVPQPSRTIMRGF
jgi:hypothetical protein